MTAIVANGPRGRVYLPRAEDHVRTRFPHEPSWAPDSDLPRTRAWLSRPGLRHDQHRDLFTRDNSSLSRPLATSCVSAASMSSPMRSQLACKMMVLVWNPAVRAATAYADAVATYLALAVDRLADYNSSLCSWNTTRELVSHVFDSPDRSRWFGILPKQTR